MSPAKVLEEWFAGLDRETFNRIRLEVEEPSGLNDPVIAELEREFAHKGSKDSH